MRTYIHTGVLESRGNQTMFGAILSNEEEILIEGSAYGCKENDPVVFDLSYAHKFKRAKNVMNLNSVLENISHLLFHSSNKKTPQYQEELLDTKMKASFLLEKEYNEVSLSHSARRALSFLRENQ